MNGLRISVLVVGWLAISVAAFGQNEDRRYRLPDRAATSRDLEEMLRQRLAQLENNDEARKLMDHLLKNKFSDEQLRQFRDLQRMMQANPELLKSVQDALRDQPDLRRSIEQALQKSLGNQEMRQLVQRLRNPPENPPDNPRVPPTPIQTDPPRPPDRPPHRPPENRPTPPMQTPEKLPETVSDWFGKQATEWSRGLTRWTGNLDNATMVGLVESLRTSGLLPTQLELPEWMKTTASTLPTTLQSWLPDANTLGGMPGLGNWNVVTPEMPALSTPESSGSLLGILLLVAFVGIGIAIWWNLSSGELLARKKRSARELGAWPVRPDRVSTRGEIVLAFEYLARLLLGLTIETSHHHEVGRRLAAQAASNDQQRAAEELTNLYEQARYTPLDEPLSPQDVALAREALGRLATGNAA